METEQTTTDDDVISARKAAGMLGITVQQLQEWRPYFPHELRPDGKFVYRRSSIKEFMQLRDWDRNNPEKPDPDRPLGWWPYAYDETVDLSVAVAEALAYPGRIHINVPTPDIIVVYFGQRSLVLSPRTQPHQRRPAAPPAPLPPRQTGHHPHLPLREVPRRPRIRRPVRPPRQRAPVPRPPRPRSRQSRAPLPPQRFQPVGLEASRRGPDPPEGLHSAAPRPAETRRMDR